MRGTTTIRDRDLKGRNEEKCHVHAYIQLGSDMAPHTGGFKFNAPVGTANQPSPPSCSFKLSADRCLHTVSGFRQSTRWAHESNRRDRVKPQFPNAFACRTYRGCRDGCRVHTVSRARRHDEQTGVSSCRTVIKSC